MIILLLSSLLLTSWTGLELYTKAGKGPLTSVENSQSQTIQINGKDLNLDNDDERQARENEGGKKWLEELHEALASFSLLLVFIHIGEVFIAGWFHKENLVKAMWTGYKTPPEDFKTD